jgi:peptidyl-prolyl cis-trans isomerase SurA
MRPVPETQSASRQNAHFMRINGLAVAALLAVCLAVTTRATAEQAPAAKPAKTAAAASPAAGTSAGAGKVKSGNQSIIALINDEPITAYEVEQRAAFIALSTGGGGDMKAKAEARWKQIVKDPKTNTRFQELMKAKNVQSKEEARELQTKFVKELQANMVAQLQREQRSGAVAGSKTKAQDELIDEKIKLQEAKKLSAVATDEEVSTFVRSIAERNKMTEAQFGTHLKGMGVDIQTMKSRFRAEISWREVIRRKFGNQIAITNRDVDRLVASSAAGDWAKPKRWLQNSRRARI